MNSGTRLKKGFIPKMLYLLNIEIVASVTSPRLDVLKNGNHFSVLIFDVRKAELELLMHDVDYGKSVNSFRFSFNCKTYRKTCTVFKT